MVDIFGNKNLKITNDINDIYLCISMWALCFKVKRDKIIGPLNVCEIYIVRCHGCILMELIKGMTYDEPRGGMWAVIFFREKKFIQLSTSLGE